MRERRPGAGRGIGFHPAANDRPVLETDQLTVEYGSSAFSRSTFRAVDGVSISIAPGRSLGLVGESGCGKTSLGRAIVGLTPVTSGTVSIAETTDGTRRGRRLARSVQMVFQDPYSSLDPRQRVRDAVAEPMVVHGIKPAEDIAGRVDELLVRVGLDARIGASYPHELSGGQRQRVCIARALAIGPRLLVCDEPTSALDVSIQAQVVGLLRELQAESDVTYLFITHDLALLPQLVSEIAVMYLGRIVELGPAYTVLRRPQHPYTVSLVDAVPALGRRRTGTATHGLSGEAPSASSTSGCPFRPRCWRYGELPGETRSLCERSVPEMRTIDPAGTAIACHVEPPTGEPVALRRTRGHPVA
jgi:oligopeptide/dipeptide ABC transporter ATP-binding protein